MSTLIRLLFTAGARLPLVLLHALGMLLGWLGRRHGRPAFGEAERALEAAVDDLLRDPATRTRDLGGGLGTRDWTGKLIARL